MNASPLLQVSLRCVTSAEPWFYEACGLGIVLDSQMILSRHPGTHIP